MEPALQNLLTVDSMASAAGGWLGLLQESASSSSGSGPAGPEETAHVQPRAVWYAGQWVDALDTVGQWLEAVIMDISPDGSRVLIHYNGWTQRWDEWIDAYSQRLVPFRTHTLHSLGRRMLPVPMVIPADAPAPPPSANSFVNVLPATLDPTTNLLQLLQNANSSIQGMRWDMPVLPHRVPPAAQSPAGAGRQMRGTAAVGSTDDLRDLEQPSSFPDRTVHLNSSVSGAAAQRRMAVQTPPPAYDMGTPFPGVSQLFPDASEPEPAQGSEVQRLQRLAAVLAAAAPLADRLGRALCDLGPHLGRAARNLAAAAALLSSPNDSEPTQRIGSQLASFLASEGIHVDQITGSVGLSALPTHLRNLHTAGGNLAEPRGEACPRIAPIVHNPPQSIREYWQPPSSSQAVATAEVEEANAAARAADLNSQWIRSLRISELRRRQGVQSSAHNCTLPGTSDAASSFDGSPLSQLTTLQRSSLPSRTSGQCQVRHAVAQALTAGRLSQVELPPASMVDVGGDVDDRIQLQASLAAIRRSIQAMAVQSDDADDDLQLELRPGVRVPTRRPHPPPRPTARVPRSDEVPAVAALLGNAPPEQRQVGTLHFANSVETDVGPTPQLAPRARRVSMLGARVRSDRAEQQRQASAASAPAPISAPAQAAGQGIFSAPHTPMAFDISRAVIAALIPRTASTL